MAYIQQSDLLSDIAPEFLTQALDDDRDQTADTERWEVVLSAVESEINAILDQEGVTLPLVAPYDDAVITATRYTALEKLWLRRGVHSDERNPFATRARAAREALQRWAKDTVNRANTVAWGSETQITF